MREACYDRPVRPVSMITSLPAGRWAVSCPLQDALQRRRVSLPWRPATLRSHASCLGPPVLSLPSRNCLDTSHFLPTDIKSLTTSCLVAAFGRSVPYRRQAGARVMVFLDAGRLRNRARCEPGPLREHERHRLALHRRGNPDKRQQRSGPSLAFPFYASRRLGRRERVHVAPP